MENLKEQKLNLPRQEINLYLNSPKKGTNVDSLIEFKDINNLTYNDLKSIELIKNKLIAFAQTPFAISYYYNIIKVIYPNINITREEIGIFLIYYIKKIKLFLIPIKKNIYVLTLFDGAICINKNYFANNFEKNNSLYNINIYIILFQEITHAIIKLLSVKDYILNNTLKNDDDNNNHGNMAIKLINNNNKMDTKAEDDLILEDLSLSQEFIDNKKIGYINDFNLSNFFKS